MDIRDPMIRGLDITATDTMIGVGSLRTADRAVGIPTHRFIHTKGTKMARNTIAIAALAALAIGALATSADAHPKLTSVSPATDVPSKAFPTEIKLNFSEDVIAKFSGLELKDEAGKAVATGVPANDPADRRQLVVPLPRTAGRYTVMWHAVSQDTHHVKGEYSFEVAH